MAFARTQLDKPATAALKPRVLGWLPLAITLLAGLVCYGLFYNRGAWLSVIGYSVSPAERVLQGEVPYRDFLYNYTPGMLWLNALLMRLFGVSLMTIHVGLLVFKVATLMILYFVAKRLVGVWAALVPVALSLSWIGYKYIFGVFPTQYSMPFILLGIIFMLTYDEGGRLRFLFLSGLSVGIVFLFKYNVGILLFACGTLAIIIRELGLNHFFRKATAPEGDANAKQLAAAPASQTSSLTAMLTRGLLQGLSKSAVYWLGFAFSLLPLIFYMARHQALGAMLDHFLHHVSAYGNERAVPLPHVKLLAPVFAGLLVVVAGALFILRKAHKYFQPYLLLVFLLAAIALLIPNRAYIIKNSAMAFMAYLPIFLFSGTAIVVLWQLKKDSERGSQKSEVRSSESGVERQDSGFRVQDSGATDLQTESPRHPDTLSKGERIGTPLRVTSSWLHRFIASSLLSNWWQENGRLIIVGLFALGAYLEMYPRADYYHLVRALPPTFLLIALLGARLLPRLRDYLSGYLPSTERALVFCSAVVVALLMLVGFVNTWQPNFNAGFRFIDRTPLAIERAEGILVPPKQVEFVESLVGLIQANSAPDDTVFSFGQRGAGFYFLSGRRNPTKFVWWRNVGIKKEDRDAVLQMINQKSPKLILLQDSLKDLRVRDAVNANYHRVGAASGIGVYDRNL
jgi:hypothetical protein